MENAMKANEFKARLNNLKLITNASYLNAGWDRQRCLDKLKREVEDAFDNLQISEADYNALQIAIKESY
jgi:hypothetical protein